EADLVPLVAVAGGGDSGGPVVGPGDAALAGEPAHRAVGVEAHRCPRGLETAEPAADGHAHPATLRSVAPIAAAVVLDPLRPALPHRMLGDALEHFGGAVRLPRLVVDHGIAFRDEMPLAEGHGIEPERARDLLHLPLHSHD